MTPIEIQGSQAFVSSRLLSSPLAVWLASLLMGKPVPSHFGPRTVDESVIRVPVKWQPPSCKPTPTTPNTAGCQPTTVALWWSLSGSQNQKTNIESIEEWCWNVLSTKLCSKWNTCKTELHLFRDHSTPVLPSHRQQHLANRNSQSSSPSRWQSESPPGCPPHPGKETRRGKTVAESKNWLFMESLQWPPLQARKSKQCLWTSGSHESQGAQWAHSPWSHCHPLCTKWVGLKRLDWQTCSLA